MNPELTDQQYNLIMEYRNQISSDRSWGSDLPEKEFFKGMAMINPQSYGARVEKRIQEELGYSKIKSKDACGDILSPCGSKVEVKISLLTSTNSGLNLVQLRLFQDVDYYLCVAYDCRDISKFNKYVFLLTHDEMVEETLNATAAHGTSGVNELNKNVELRMTVECDDYNPQFVRWKNKYLKTSYSEVNECIQQK